MQSPSPTHRHVTSDEWHAATLADVDGLIRVSTGGASKLDHTSNLPAIGRKHWKSKIMISYATHAGGQTDQHVVRVYFVAVDLDGDATDDDVGVLMQRWTDALIIWANGLQVFFLSSGDWPTDARCAYAIGREAQGLCPGLRYDRFHLRSDGSPAAHRGHLYRCGWGWASKRNCPVDCFLPVAPLPLLRSVEVDL